MSFGKQPLQSPSSRKPSFTVAGRGFADFIACAFPSATTAKPATTQARKPGMTTHDIIAGHPPEISGRNAANLHLPQIHDMHALARLYMCVCVCVCVCVCMHVCTFTRTHMRTHLSTDVRTYIRTYVTLRTYMRTDISTVCLSVRLGNKECLFSKGTKRRVRCRVLPFGLISAMTRTNRPNWDQPYGPHSRTTPGNKNLHMDTNHFEEP